MISKNTIADIRKLHQKKYRDEFKLFLVEGTKSVRELLQSKTGVKELYASKEWLERNSELIPETLPVSMVSAGEMERISCLKTPSEVLAIAVTPDYSPDDIRENLPLLVLDDIRDPGNMGTIIRTADWFGFRQILCSGSSVEFTNPKTIQATMGSFCRVKLIYTDLPEFFKNRNNDTPIFGTFMEGEDIANLSFPENAVFVIGNEANGISDALLPFITNKIHIPSPVTSPVSAESLNASIATAIILYRFSLSLKQ